MASNLISGARHAKLAINNAGYPEISAIATVVNGFFVVDRRWTVQYWNKAAEQILGIAAKDVLGENLWEKFVAILPLDFYLFYYKAFRQDTPVHFTEYWAEMNAWFDVIAYHSNDALSVSFKSSQSGLYRDPAPQLEMINELYRFVTGVTNDALWEWDIETDQIFWIDGGHKRAFGYPIENALLPRDFWEICLHPDDSIRIRAGLEKILQECKALTWEEEYRFKKTNGDYAYVHDRSHIIYRNNKACRMIGATQDITEKVLLQHRLVEDRMKTQKEITDAVLTAQENERAEIGKELHDNINQILGATKLYIEMVKTEEKNRDFFLDKASVHIIHVIEEIRRISKVLLPQSINLIGLGNSINILVEDLIMVHPLKIEFCDDGFDTAGIDEKMQMNIFRIVQEQVNNIIKHAHATHASINLVRHENQIVLLISDNGKGCNTAIKRKGVGIRNIMSRAELYHGRITIVSQPGEGYELKVILPL